MKRPNTLDEYIVSYPKEVQKLLHEIRDTIRKAAPDAEEEISYGMPYYRFHGRLLYFAAHTNHIGLYPMITGVEAFKSKLSAYKCAKGTIQFPLDKPLPLELISKIVKFRVKENLDKVKSKTKTKAKK